MGKLTKIGHISRGLDFTRQRSSIWLGIGRLKVWPDESNPPTVDTDASAVDELIGLVKLKKSSMIKLDADGDITINGISYSYLSDSDALKTYGPKAVPDPNVATETPEVIARPSVDTDVVTVSALKNTPVKPNLLTVTATDVDGGTMTITDQKVDDLYGKLTEAGVVNSPTNYIDYINDSASSRTAGQFTDSSLEKNKIKFSKKVKADTDVTAQYTYEQKGNFLYLQFELGVNDFPNKDYRQYGVYVDSMPAEGYANSTVLEKENFSSLGNLVYLENVTVRKRYANTRHLIEIVIEE